MYICLRSIACTVACYSVADSLVRFEPITEDPDPLQEIQICARYGPDTMAIRKPTYGMIQRFVPVRALKTRWRFRSKIASFHVSVYSCVIYRCQKYIYVTCFISCDHLLYFISMFACIPS